ncbi:unnamed protein product [Prorocentrum cordatum]|uniref:Uncharacterized protein n=1 Tax=Prorocentrum cordatum TaxID=2364126 RepID=A0ABN9QIQ0_9DINO|nr:unnamed protein product [Polarella glacialis]
MKCSAFVALLAAAVAPRANASLRRGVLGEQEQQPIVTASAGELNNDANFAVSAQDDTPARPPGYRAAWDDCGGVGASATERMRSISARTLIKGWAKPLPFQRHAAQDCGHAAADEFGTLPGPGQQVNYPGPEVHAAQDDAGLKTAADTLAKYPLVAK